MEMWGKQLYKRNGEEIRKDYVLLLIFHLTETYDECLTNIQNYLSKMWSTYPVYFISSVDT
jgi:hypothetical protein